MKKLLLAVFLLTSINAWATQVTYPTTYAANGQVTNVNLNGNFTAASAVVNGKLDNTNADTTNGYRFYQTVAVLPAAGSQGAVYFLTSDNSLNFDTGTTFSKSISVTSPSANQVPVYSGSSWVGTSITNIGFTTGMIVMWSGTIATIPSGWYLCNGSNGTPDLRNRFIVGADADSGGAAKSTITGAAAQSGGSTTITQGNLPSYNLSLPSDSSAGTIGTNNVAFEGSAASNNTIPVPSGGSGTAYTQPFWALAYIMKS